MVLTKVILLANSFDELSLKLLKLVYFFLMDRVITTLLLIGQRRSHRQIFVFHQHVSDFVLLAQVFLNRSDPLLFHELYELSWDLFQNLSGELLGIIFELFKFDELYYIRGHEFIVLVRIQRCFIGVKDIH